LSSDGNTLVSGGWDNNVLSVDIRRPGSPTIYRGHTDWLLSTAVVPNVGHVVSGGWDSTVRLWSGPNSSSVLAGHTSTITSVAVSPDARLIASGSYDSTVKVWNVVGGHCERTLAGHTGNINKVCFTPKSDNLILTGGDDRVVKLWDVPTGKLKNEFVCNGPVTALGAVSKAGELLMVYGDFIGNLYVTKFHHTL